MLQNLLKKICLKSVKDLDEIEALEGRKSVGRQVFKSWGGTGSRRLKRDYFLWEHASVTNTVSSFA